MMNNKKIKQLLVSTPQGHAGLLTRESRYSFNYQTTERKQEVSLVMPLRAESYASGALPAPFLQNRPEGFLLERLQERFAKDGGLSDMQLLAFAGAQIGRLQFDLPEQSKPRPVAQIGREALLKEAASAQLFEFLVDTYLMDSGVSGVQPKVLIPDMDKHVLGRRQTLVQPELIVKAAGMDYPRLTQNEYLCMSAAKAAGLPVPPFWLSEDGNLFVMERFDLLPDGSRLGFEDFSALFNKPGTPNAKYESSYETVAKGVSAFCTDSAARMDSLHRLFDYVALSVLVRNGDAHLKNFGLLYEHPADTAAVRLSPLYDVVTTSIYNLRSRDTGPAIYDRRLALKLGGSKEYPSRAKLIQFGRENCHVTNPAQIIERLGQALSDTLAQEAHRLDKELLGAMRKEWMQGLISLQPTALAMPHHRPADKSPDLVQSMPGWPTPDDAGLVSDKIKSASGQSQNIGHIIAADPNYIYQKIGRETIKHDLSQFTPEQLKSLAGNQLVTLSYQAGQLIHCGLDRETFRENQIDR